MGIYSMHRIACNVLMENMKAHLVINIVLSFVRGMKTITSYQADLYHS